MDARPPRCMGMACVSIGPSLIGPADTHRSCELGPSNTSKPRQASSAARMVRIMGFTRHMHCARFCPRAVRSLETYKPPGVTVRSPGHALLISSSLSRAPCTPSRAMKQASPRLPGASGAK
ncbi:hypothetical protein DUNSADRAFT_3232 [Dunaliella salina]|uniref:Encoded protein n=1 Tax=Dunaliella salina TaxID=3046 RepID=A0ABQ7FVK1_DUNSA|nr:hypothetical protein DUNSADRAFT_3232 [Dunaliella salina]|eukprot:KAF5826416.1 hypothetical protein DUNSADRAFT_3232 [Dunaliella salina]